MIGIVEIYVFVLAGFVGYQVITRVPPLLHTPLMSATNAISGVISPFAGYSHGTTEPTLSPLRRTRLSSTNQSDWSAGGATSVARIVQKRRRPVGGEDRAPTCPEAFGETGPTGETGPF